MGLSMGGALAVTAASVLGTKIRSLVIVDWSPWPEDAEGRGRATKGIRNIKLLFLRSWDSFTQAVDDMCAFNPRRTRGEVTLRLAQQLRRQVQ